MNSCDSCYLCQFTNEHAMDTILKQLTLNLWLMWLLLHIVIVITQSSELIFELFWLLLWTCNLYCPLTWGIATCQSFDSSIPADCVVQLELELLWVMWLRLHIVIAITQSTELTYELVWLLLSTCNQYFPRSWAIIASCQSFDSSISADCVVQLELELLWVIQFLVSMSTDKRPSNCSTPVI